MKKPLSILLFFSFLSQLSFAQTEPVPEKLPEKYNGFGLPNTKFKKVRLKAPVAIVPPITQTATPQTVAPTAVPIKKPVTATTINPLPGHPIAHKPKTESPYTKLSLDASVTYQTQSEKQKDGTQYKYLYYEVDPKLSLGDFTVTGFLYFYQNTDNAGDNQWDDSAVLFNYKASPLGDYFLFTPFLSYGFPLSKGSREGNFLKSTIGTSVAVALNTKNMGMPSTSVSYSLGYTKMFTSSEVDAKGEPNVDYRLRQRLNLGYSITEKFAFKTRFQFDSAYALDDFITNAFLHFEQFEYQFNDFFGIFIGHTNSNGLFNPETYQNNLKLYDNSSSEFYVGFGLSIKSY